jgi:hypothetical protein
MEKSGFHLYLVAFQDDMMKNREGETPDEFFL